MDLGTFQNPITDGGDQFRDYPCRPLEAGQREPLAQDAQATAILHDDWDTNYEIRPMGSKDAFVPWSYLHDVFNFSSVRATLAFYSPNTGWNGQTIDNLAETICYSHQPRPNNSYLKVFAILCLLSRQQDIEIFVMLGINDSTLPLRLPSKDHYQHTFSNGPEICSKLIAKTGWTKKKLRNFFDNQWLVISPFFVCDELRPYHYRLDVDMVLPTVEEHAQVTKIDSQFDKRKEGGFGVVDKIKFHPSHYNFGHYPISNKDDYFARKTLHVSDRQQFATEVSNPIRINRANNIHLARLLVSYENPTKSGKTEFSMIFPWASCDLEGYWKHMCSRRTPDLILWMAKQCAGLASALVVIHNPEGVELRDDTNEPLYGRHGDVKPSNILVYREEDTGYHDGTVLVLNDFGISRYKSIQSRSNGDPRGQLRSPTYCSPQFDLKDGVLCRKVDIWGLGCTFLEFVLWYLKGFDAFSVDFPNFREEPNQYSIDSDRFFRIDASLTVAVVKPAVLKYIKDLHGHKGCTQFLHDLLDCIEEDMLVVNREERKTSREVLEKLKGLYGKCLEDNTYWATPAPWVTGGTPT